MYSHWFVVVGLLHLQKTQEGISKKGDSGLQIMAVKLVFRGSIEIKSPSARPSYGIAKGWAPCRGVPESFGSREKRESLGKCLKPLTRLESVDDWEFSTYSRILNFAFSRRRFLFLLGGSG